MYHVLYKNCFIIVSSSGGGGGGGGGSGGTDGIVFAAIIVVVIIIFILIFCVTLRHLAIKIFNLHRPMPSTTKFVSESE